MGEAATPSRGGGSQPGLTLSPLTVKTHANHAMTKTGARDRAQLVVLAYQSWLAGGQAHPGVRRPPAFPRSC